MRKLYSRLLFISICLLMSDVLISQTFKVGALDTSFNKTDIGLGFGVSTNGQVYDIAQQIDGKYIICGEFTSYAGKSINGIARVNVDGTLDTTFNQNGTGGAGIKSVAIQSDGKILIGGNFTYYNGTYKLYIARLNIDGSIDNSFSAPSMENNINKVSIQPDSKILIAGNFNFTVNGVMYNTIARLNYNGSVDTSFNGTGANGSISAISLQTDGKILIGGSFSNFNSKIVGYCARLNTNGSLDTLFNYLGTGFNYYVYSLALQADGKILVGGNFGSYNGVVVPNSLTRLFSNGKTDTTFNKNGSGCSSSVSVIKVQSDSKILIGGSFLKYNGDSLSPRIIRLKVDGKRDSTFTRKDADFSTGNDVKAILQNSNGKIIVGDNTLFQLSTTGSYDKLFNIGTGASSSIKAMALQADGKMVIGGSFINYNGVTVNGITRLLSDGSIDTTFNKLGSGADALVSAIAIQTDGKIIVAGDFTIFNAVSKKYIARLNSDGSIDATFNVNNAYTGSSSINHINIQSDGKILLSTVSGFYRLNANGTIDNTFITSGSTTSSYTCSGFPPRTYYYTSSTFDYRSNTSITNSDASVLFIGNRYTTSYSRSCYSTSYSSNYTYCGLFQLNSVGTVTREWLVGYSGAQCWGSCNYYYNQYYISHLLKQTDGKILLAGNFNSFDGKYVNQNIMRLNADYSIDSTFNKFGVGLSGTINSVSIQPNGKILISGNIYSYNNVLISNGFVRLKSDGTLDTTFNKLGTGPSNNKIVATSQLSNNKKVIIAGDFTSYNGVGRNNIARLFNCVDTYSSKDTTICSNKVPFVWNGTSYSTTGKYTASFTNSEGCDSIATLNLTVKNSTTSTITITACGSYFWNGTNYTTSGTKTFNTTNSVGCDSIATLNLTINNSSVSNTTATIAITALPYTWNGINCTSNGTYTKTFVGGNSKGCDSTATLTLLISSEIIANSQWTWVSGDSTTNQLGIYGTKGIAAATNKPGARYGSISWKDASGNFWLFGGNGFAASGYGNLNDLWKYNTITGQWTWVSGDNTIEQLGVYGTKGTAATNNKPGARQQSVSWTDASGNLWLFGGYGFAASGSGGKLNDLWKYNTSTGQWTWVSGDNTINQLGVYGTKGIAAATNKPGARHVSVSWTDASGNVWLFGGSGFASSVSAGYLNDLWKYNTSTNQWTWVSGDNTTNQSGVYGTKGIAAASNKPGARGGSISWTDASGNVWLFGGDGFAASGSAFYLNDLWKYNTSSGQWTWVSGDSTTNQFGVYSTKGTAAATNKPGARFSSVSWTDASGNLWLFGGYGFAASVTGRLNDLWKYNTNTGQWTWVSGDNTINQLGVYGTKGIAAATNKPGARHVSVSWTDASGNVWLFGGSGFASSVSAGYLNDLWKIAPICSGSITTQTACDSYLWNGVTYANSGTYTKTFTGTAGCDSLATLNLTVKNSTTSITNISICPSQLPYSWNGSRTSAGTYTYTTTNSQGCDSVATLNLTVKTNTTSTTNISICPSQLPYSWNGSRTSAGTYTYTTTNSQGCDSVATLNLNVKSTSTSTTNRSICQSQWTSGMYMIWNGLIFMESGSKTAHLTNSVGCDSAATLNFTIIPSSTSTTNVSICASELPYSWNGSRTSAGTYTFTTTNSQSCDSVATLNLTVKTNTISTTNVSICPSELPFSWNGLIFNASGSQTTHLINSQGCDSAAMLNLTVKTNTTSTTNVSICPSALPYSWNGLTFTGAGSQTAHLTNSQGCDSAATLNLTVKTNTTSTTNTSICPSALPYSWNGLTFNAAGSQTAHLANSQGCDSAATLNLAVKTNTTSTTNTSICPSALPYTWNGLTFNAAGSQTAHLANSQECDSAATLNLAVKTNTTSTTNTSICPSALPYTWNGLTFNAAGNQTAHLANSQGCDSAATLNLTVKTNTTSTTNTSICPSQLPYSWNGLTFNAAGSQTAHLANSQGCDSTATLNLTVKTNTTSTTNTSICPSALPYSWNGLIFNAAGSQTAHLINSQGCDSSATIVVTITEPTVSNNNISVCSNQLPYSWNGNSYSSAGIYIVHLTNAAGCDSAATLVLSVSTSSASSISISSTATTICAGTLVTFTATPVNGGTAPIYQWKKNGIDVGSNSNTYSSTTLANGDNIWCILTSNSACATNAISNSNIVNMTVKALSAMTSITNGKSNVATALICSLGSITRYYNNTPYGTWSSNNPTVASVSSTGSGGNVKANTSGTATISYSLAASNGCVSSSSLLVTIAPQTAPTAISGNNSICVNATTALSSTAPVGTTGVWTSSNNRGTINASGVYTGKNAGTWGEVRYTVTNTTTGCKAYSSYAITVNPTPVVPTITYASGTANPQLGAPTGGFCVGKVFSVVGTPNIPAGAWSSTGAVSITAGGSVTINTVGAGSIKYTYTSAAGCSNSRTMNGNGYTCAARGVSVSGEGLVVSGDFTLYPNPAKGSINLNVETLIGAGSILVTDIYGKTVKKQTLSIGTNIVDVSNLSKGLYFVSTITNEGKITKKLVVE